MSSSAGWFSSEETISEDFFFSCLEAKCAKDAILSLFCILFFDTKVRKSYDFEHELGDSSLITIKRG